jgi:hypothetical protein
MKCHLNPSDGSNGQMNGDRRTDKTKLSVFFATALLTPLKQGRVRPVLTTPLYHYTWHDKILASLLKITNCITFQHCV